MELKSISPAMCKPEDTSDQKGGSAMYCVLQLPRSCLRLGGFSAVLLLAFGCGSTEPAGRVGGKVTYKGAPVNEGVVVISDSSTGAAAEAQIGSDGVYTITPQKGGLPPGDYKVTVAPPEIPAPAGDGSSEPGTIPKPVDNIPQKYRSPTTTPLTLTIKDGDNQFDISMQD